MVEALLGEGEIEDVADLEGDIAVAGGRDARPRPLEMLARDVDRDDLGFGARGGQVHGLRARAAAAFQHLRSGRVARVVMKELGQRVGLVGQASRLAQRVAVDVTGVAHGQHSRKVAQAELATRDHAQTAESVGHLERAPSHLGALVQARLRLFDRIDGEDAECHRHARLEPR